MLHHHGAHGQAGATETGNAGMGAHADTATGRVRPVMPEDLYRRSGTDPELNARAKRPMTLVRARRARRTLVACLVALIAVLACLTAGSSRTVGLASDGTGDGSITIALKLAPVSLDIRRQSGSALEQILIGNVYESLVSRGTDNKVHPGLAYDWDVSQDGLTYTFRLNQRMRFSNGDTLDAEDVVWSLEELRARGYYNHEQIEALDHVEALDANTVRLTLSRPDSNLLWYLTGRCGLVYDKDGVWDERSGALGSGPYQVVSFDPNDRIVLRADPHYWGEDHRAAVGNVVIRFISDENAAVNALSSGDAQIVTPVSSTLAEPLRDDPRYNVTEVEGSDKFVLAFNMADPVLKDARIRKAIRHAIDHGQIIAARGGVDTALGGPIPATDPGYEDLTGLYPHDVAQARTLMRQAGYTTEHPLALTLTYANTYGTDIGDQLASQLASIGIDLEVRVVEFSTWLQDVHTNGDYQLSLVDHAESHDFYKWTDPDYYYHYDNAEVRDLYAKALASVDEEQASDYLARAARLVSEDAPADWLFGWRVVAVAAADVRGLPDRLIQSTLPLWRLSYAS